ncbi:MAG TPA: divalent metal cation transporter [Candidatus Binatia bacterium]|nr:divalent metal cation transporter [Candidatus Binatia bacterium]
MSNRRFVRGVGPGLVSGASANDPTTVGSIAAVGAATGYGMAWLVVVLLPMLALVQAIAASVATMSQMSLQQAILRTFGRGPAIIGAVAIVAVSLFTLVADVQAGAQALKLLSGVPFYYFVIPLAAVAYWLLATKSYLRIERILASLTLIFLCYVASAILARPDWGLVLRSICVPHFDLSPVFATGAIALLGTTLTSYVYFWESIEVAERRPAPSQLRAVNTDAVAGMLVAGSSFLFILIATAATSGAHRVPIQTAAEAATALRPLAGPLDQTLFGVGLLASAAIAIPVIAATNGYVVAQTFGWPAGLAQKPAEAKGFYRVIFGSLAIAAVFALLPIPTISLLYWVSVIAGLATPITLAFTMLVARDRNLMHGKPIGIALAGAGWLVTAVVTASALAFIVSFSLR